MIRRGLISFAVLAALVVAFLLWPAERQAPGTSLKKEEIGEGFKPEAIPAGVAEGPRAAPSKPEPFEEPKGKTSASPSLASLEVFVDAPGQPLTHSRLGILHEDGSFRSEALDPQAKANFTEISPGKVWARLFGPGREAKPFPRPDAEALIDLMAGDRATATLRFLGERPAEVSGRVSLEGNFSAGPFRVSFRALAPPSGFESFPVQDFQTKTDASGFYKLGPLPTGKFLVDITSDVPGHQALGRKEAELRPGPGNEANFLLALGRVRGRVLDASGAARRGVRIELRDESGKQRGGWREILTNDRGEFSSDWVAVGVYHLVAGAAVRLEGGELEVQVEVGEIDLGDLTIPFQGR